MTEGDARYVETLKAHLRTAGCEPDVKCQPNVSREEKFACGGSLQQLRSRHDWDCASVLCRNETRISHHSSVTAR
jgi:hypothetical protein